MMDDFQTFVLREGCRPWNPLSVPIDIRRTYTTSISRAESYYHLDATYYNLSGGAARIRIGYLYDPWTCGGVAGKVGSTLCAGVFSRTVFRYIELSLCCVLQDCFLPNFGDSSDNGQKRNNLKKDIVWGFHSEWPNKETRDSYFEFLRVIRPNCEKRQLLVHIVTQLLLDYLWAHEVSHCFWGHTDYLSDKFPETSISSTFSEVPVSRCDTNILLEQGADSMALSSWFRVERMEQDAALMAYGGLSEHDYLTIRALIPLLSCYVQAWDAYRSFGADVFLSGTLSSHPHPIERYLFVRDVLIQERSPLSAEDQLKNVSSYLGITYDDVMRLPREQYVGIDKTDPAISSAEKIWDTLSEVSESFQFMDFWLNELWKPIESEKKRLARDGTLVELYNTYMYIH